MLWVMAIGVVFTIVRCTLPVEFPGMQNIHLPTAFSHFFRLARMPVWRNISPLQIFLLFWIIGSIFFVTRLIVRIVRYVRTPLEADSTPSPRLKELYAKVLEELDCPRKGTPLVSSHVSVAHSTGFFYPDVILPSAAEHMPEEEVCYILKHEICHYLYHDVWINLVVEILCCLFWWNPAIYLLQYTVSNLLELRCDSRVCKDLSSEQMEDYYQILVNALRAQSKSKYKDPLFNGLVGGLKRKARNDDVIRRFRQIKNAIDKKPQQKWVSVVAFVIACTLFVGSYTVTFQTFGFPPEDEIVALNFEDDSSYIMRHSDGKLEVFFEHQTYGTISPEQLQEEPFSSMLIVDVY